MCEREWGRIAQFAQIGGCCRGTMTLRANALLLQTNGQGKMIFRHRRLYGLPERRCFGIALSVVRNIWESSGTELKNRVVVHLVPRKNLGPKES